MDTQKGVRAMATNRGKSFECIVKECFEKSYVSIDRLHDQTTGYAGSTNICDLIVYRKPNQIYIECKSVHGNLLSISSNPKPDKNGKLHGFYGNITDKQWDGLLEKADYEGVIAGVMCWWIDHDVTLFIPIKYLKAYRDAGNKSISYKAMKYFANQRCYVVPGVKKKVFFNYDMDAFLDEVQR